MNLKERILDFKKNGFSIKIYISDNKSIVYQDNYEIDYFDENILWLMHANDKGKHEFINLSHAKKIDFIPPRKMV